MFKKNIIITIKLLFNEITSPLLNLKDLHSFFPPYTKESKGINPQHSQWEIRRSLMCLWQVRERDGYYYKEKYV